MYSLCLWCTRRCSNVTIGEAGSSSVCQWNYNGLGIEYQLLAGPSFILAFTIGGLVIGALADRYNRLIFYFQKMKQIDDKYYVFVDRITILAICICLFSACTVVMGMAQAVWHLYILRFGVAFGFVLM